MGTQKRKRGDMIMDMGMQSRKRRDMIMVMGTQRRKRRDMIMDMGTQRRKRRDMIMDMIMMARESLTIIPRKSQCPSGRSVHWRVLPIQTLHPLAATGIPNHPRVLLPTRWNSNCDEGW